MRLLFFTVLLLFTRSGYAANADIVSDLQNAFAAQTATWFAPLSGWAVWLLIILATISYTWNAAQLVLSNADLQEFVRELVRMVMFTGFFLALIFNAQAWSQALINGFLFLGNDAAGPSLSGNLNPAGILERGFILVGDIMNASSMTTYLAFLFISLAVLILYALIAAYALLVMAEMYIVTAAGVIMLGFGGSQWTVDYAHRYLTYCVSVGAKLYVMFLIIGLGEQFIYNWAINPALDKSSLIIGLTIIGVLVILALLVKMLPDMIQGVISGASIGHSTPSVGSMFAAGAGAAIGAGAGALGAGLAVKEAANLAEHQLSEGGSSGLLGEAASIGESLGESSTAENSNSTPLSSPSNATRSPSTLAVAGQTMKNLGHAAAANIAGRIMGDYAHTHGTMGGSMAQHMKAERMGTPHANSPSHLSSGGSISGASSMSGFGQRGATGWFAQTGGYNSLSPEHKTQAQEAHLNWQESDPQIHTFNLNEYVQYVQDRHKEKAENN
ncbi:P-type conjugative transfer protein TrbL [Vibrio parahaemolyticus]|nr:P-type conjugative transfer protein TrbL [Vibrio parahaemolyticus]